jgi:hypothetical protein
VRKEEPSAKVGLASATGNSTTARMGGSSADDSASCKVIVMQLIEGSMRHGKKRNQAGQSEWGERGGLRIRELRCADFSRCDDRN